MTKGDRFAIKREENLPAAGGYRLGLILFILKHKPSAWHRFWTRIFLGWTWEDEPPYRGKTVTRYLATILLAALGCLLIAGGAVLLWLHPDATAVRITIVGACCYLGAMALTARPQL